MNPLFVGIDVSSKNNVAYLMKPDGSKHSSFSVQNNLGGAKLLSERIVSALGSMQLERVVIGLEATSIYGDSLVYALREDGSLGRFQRKIHVLNPKQVRKFKEAYPDLPKNDWVDAFVIADHLRFGRIAKEVYMDDYRYQALRTLTRARFDVIQNLTREKQRFANYLFLKCSGMALDKDIQNTSATTSAAARRGAEPYRREQTIAGWGMKITFSELPCSNRAGLFCAVSTRISAWAPQARATEARPPVASPLGEGAASNAGGLRCGLQWLWRMPQFVPMPRPLQAVWSSFWQTSWPLPDSRHLAAASCAAAMARWRSMSALVSLSLWVWACARAPASSRGARANAVRSFFMESLSGRWG